MFYILCLLFVLLVDCEASLKDRLLAQIRWSRVILVGCICDLLKYCKQVMSGRRCRATMNWRCRLLNWRCLLSRMTTWWSTVTRWRTLRHWMMSCRPLRQRSEPVRKCCHEPLIWPTTACIDSSKHVNTRHYQQTTQNSTNIDSMESPVKLSSLGPLLRVDLMKLVSVSIRTSVHKRFSSFN